MPKVQHMVLIRFRPEVTDKQIDQMMASLAELQGLIPGIEYYGGGPYSSPEGLSKGFTHGFLMTFRDSAARDMYLPHPEHERVKQAILPFVDDVVVFDFEAASPQNGQCST